MIPIQHLLIFTSLLFLTGLYGAVTRRNMVGILISIEIMLNAVNINFIGFSRISDVSAEVAQVFVIFVIVLAAATAAVGLAIVRAIYRNQKTDYTAVMGLLNM